MKSVKIPVFAVFIFPALFYSGAVLAAQLPAAADLPAFTAKDLATVTGDFTLPEPALIELLPRSGPPPVVITVAGLRSNSVGWGPFNIVALQKLFNSIFYGEKSADQKALEEALRTYPQLYSEIAVDEASSRLTRELSDDYLVTRLRELTEYAANPITIIPFPWSRDSADSDMVIPAFTARLAQVYDAYKATGRPIYVFTHSWGSVLMHDAMHRLALTRPDVKIDKFITTGSSLTPGNAIVKGFMAIERKKEGLMTEVSKPAIVRAWVNIWAARDAFSNAIPAADYNRQADAALENVEPLLINIILYDPLLRAQAGKDFIKLRNIITWHKVYLYDFTATLDSLKRTINLAVFRPVVAEQIVKTRSRR